MDPCSKHTVGANVKIKMLNIHINHGDEIKKNISGLVFGVFIGLFIFGGCLCIRRKSSALNQFPHSSLDSRLIVIVDVIAVTTIKYHLDKCPLFVVS